MKLNNILSNNFNASEWEAKGYELPKYDISAVAKKTHEEPTWVHFGAGNIFRAFPAAILNDALNTGKYDRGVIVVESFDYEIIDKAYRPYHNLSLLVSLQSNGTIEKKVIASITESLKADKQFGEDWARLVQIFQAPSLQMVTFTITEKDILSMMPIWLVASMQSSPWVSSRLFSMSDTRQVSTPLPSSLPTTVLTMATM